MNKRESNVIFKFCDCEIELVSILAVLVRVQFIEQLLGESANQRLLVVIDNILEELINELHFEVRQVESRIVVAIKLICKVENYLVSFTLLLWVNELVHQSLTNVLHLAVTRDQTVEFELNLVRSVQIRYTFLFVRDEDTLIKKKYE